MLTAVHARLCGVANSILICEIIMIPFLRSSHIYNNTIHPWDAVFEIVCLTNWIYLSNRAHSVIYSISDADQMTMNIQNNVNNITLILLGVRVVHISDVPIPASVSVQIFNISVLYRYLSIHCGQYRY